MIVILIGRQAINLFKNKIYLILLLFTSLSYSVDVNAQLQNIFSSLLSIKRCSELSSQSIAWSNVAAYYKMNGTLGNITNNASMTATVGVSATVVNPGSVLSYTSGVISQGVSFGASATNYINAGTASAINGLTSGTLMVWLKPNPSVGGTIFYKSDNNTSAGWYLYLEWANPNLTLYFNSVYSTSNLKLKTSDVSSLLSDRWGHVMVSWDGTGTASGTHIYVNGVEQTYWYAQNSSGSKTSDSAQPLYMGKDGAGGFGSAYSGLMDEVVLWNQALSASEVTTIYQYQTCN